MRCPLRRKEKKDPPLIVRIKNNEEVQSYPSKVAQALPFCRIVDPSRNQEQSAFVVQMIWLLRNPAFFDIQCIS